jgi:tetratricopeptide (TPR) repeat protein
MNRKDIDSCTPFHQVIQNVTGCHVVLAAKRTARIVTYSAGLLLLLSGLSGCSDMINMFNRDALKIQNSSTDVPFPAPEQQQAIQNEKEEQYLAALDYWKHAQGIIDSKIATLDRELKNIATEHVENGIAYFEVKQGEKAAHEFLEALRHDPTNATALDYLQNRYEADRSIPYTVKEGDSFIKIAETVYGSATYEFALIYFSDAGNEEDLQVGSELSLAVLDSFFSQALIDYKKNTRVARKLFKAGDYKAVLPLAASILRDHPGDEEASYIVNMSLLRRAKELQDRDRFEEAINSLKQVDPAFKNVKPIIAEIREKQAEETEKETIMANSDLLQRGKKLFAQGRYSEALETYLQIAPHYSGREKAVAEVKEKLQIQADFHFKKGVKYFVEEDLVAAISEWEKTILLDPGHVNAINSIEKARNLLQKVKEIN